MSEASEVDADPPRTLATLPSELQLAILCLSDCGAVAAAAAVCHAWRAAAPLALQGKFRVAYGDCECPRPLCALLALAKLAECVGPRPSDGLAWQQEWPDCRISQARWLAAAKGKARLSVFEDRLAELGADQVRSTFVGDGINSIESEASSSYARALAWKHDHGWDRARALEVTLLGSLCPGALAQALQDRRRDRAASCWALCSALWERSWLPPLASAVAPLCYASLEGEFGLATDDPAWAALREPGVKPGASFVTCAFPFAHVANSRTFPNEGGYHVPITARGRLEYELVDSDVVCFFSAPPTSAGAGGRCRSLIPTDDGVYRLPPFATVTFQRRWECCEWVVGDVPINRRRWDVSVAF